MTRNRRDVARFDRDAAETGGYLYTAEECYPGRLARERAFAAIRAACDMRGLAVIDLGCGDGTFSLAFKAAGAAKVLGVDPAAAAVARARERAASAGADSCEFLAASLYELPPALEGTFDVAALVGVLHHLDDPVQAIAVALRLAKTVVIVEANGLNPVLKLIERFSRYHREHGERSFRPGTVEAWCAAAGASAGRGAFVNMVPTRCPDWFAALCHAAQPVVEAIPLVRALACGQYVLVARRRV